MSVRIELLAPAGNFEALQAAVSAGADAVYLGLDVFNARRGADNFTMKTLREACDFAHLRGVKVYLTFNTIIFEREMKHAMETVRQAYRAGVDAFIVQDLGIASEMQRTLPRARVHISTQMNTHSLAGVEAAASLGAKRITFARELSLEQIAMLTDAAAQLGLETEAFGHGALCVCFSGKCLMSSMIGGRSANRGTCAQPCRLPYELKNAALRKALPSPGEHLLSPKDLCTIDLLDKYLYAGVASLKIEGRMKSPDYVYAVVGVYRAVLNRLFAVRDAGGEGDSWKATPEERNTLAEAFSRGFTTAYVEHARGNEIMSYTRPNNRGVFIGRVTKVVKDAAFISSERKLIKGDVIEIWTKKGRSNFTIIDDAVTKNGVRLAFQKGDKSVVAIREGDRAFRVRSAAASFDAQPNEPRVPVNISVALKLGQPAYVYASAPNRTDAQGVPIYVEAFGNVVELARTKAVNAEEVRDHIDRLGQTPFSLNEFEAEIDEGVGIGFSALHHLRQEALDKLVEELTSYAHDRVLERTEDAPALHNALLRDYCIVAKATNPACARMAKKTGAKKIYVPALAYKRGEAVSAGQRVNTADQASYPKDCIIELPHIDFDVIPSTREYERGIDVWDYVQEEKGVLVSNWADVNRALEAGAEVEVESHVPLVNRAALSLMAARGVSRVWLSPELTLEQIGNLAREGSPVALGVTIIGKQELMTTEHCVLMSQGPCDENCDECPRRKSPHYLIDRKGFEFPVITDSLGRSHIYNSVELDIAHALPDLIAAGVTQFMVDTTMMNAEETAHAIGRAVRALEIGRRDGNAVSKVNGATSGHLYRAVE